MTENESIKKHIEDCEHRIGNILGFMESNSDADILSCEENIAVLKEVIIALEEVEQYRAIGTIEEFKALKQWKSDIIESFSEYDVNSVDELMKRFRELTEKAEPKKPRWYGHHFCPNCDSIVYVNCGKDIYCPKCGQRLDFGEVQNERDI